MSREIVPVKQIQADKLVVKVYQTRQEMGRAAALAVADRMRELLTARGRVVMAFAAAPSQNEFLAELSAIPDLDWCRVIAFHLDEYVGLSPDAPQGFGNFLRQRLFDRVKPGVVHYLNGNAPSPADECRRYADLLSANPLDMACIGVGENGHIAFNDPPVADFQDPVLVKMVQLEERCRLQQVHDGCFRSLDEVPTQALTLTIPAIMAARFIHCIVPGPTKRDAVKAMLSGPISTECPASILRTHDSAVLYLDRASYGE